jgi:hypothetical protein
MTRTRNGNRFRVGSCTTTGLKSEYVRRRVSSWQPSAARTFLTHPLSRPYVSAIKNPSASRKTFTGVRYSLLDLRPTFVTMAKPGSRAANRITTLFVIVRWNAATRRLRKRTSKIPPNRIARIELTAARTTIADYLPVTAPTRIGGPRIEPPSAMPPQPHTPNEQSNIACREAAKEQRQQGMSDDKNRSFGPV